MHYGVDFPLLTLPLPRTIASALIVMVQRQYLYQAHPTHLTMRLAITLLDLAMPLCLQVQVQRRWPQAVLLTLAPTLTIYCQVQVGSRQPQAMAQCACIPHALSQGVLRVSVTLALALTPAMAQTLAPSLAMGWRLWPWLG